MMKFISYRFKTELQKLKVVIDIFCTLFFSSLHCPPFGEACKEFNSIIKEGHCCSDCCRSGSTSLLWSSLSLQPSSLRSSLQLLQQLSLQPSLLRLLSLSSSVSLLWLSWLSLFCFKLILTLVLTLEWWLCIWWFHDDQKCWSSWVLSLAAARGKLLEQWVDTVSFAKNNVDSK